MSIEVALSDGDLEILAKRAPEVFDGLKERAARGKVRAVRFSTLELICKTLGREPGDVLKLCDDELRQALPCCEKRTRV